MGNFVVRGAASAYRKIGMVAKRFPEAAILLLCLFVVGISIARGGTHKEWLVRAAMSLVSGVFVATAVSLFFSAARLADLRVRIVSSLIPFLSVVLVYVSLPHDVDGGGPGSGAAIARYILWTIGAFVGIFVAPFLSSKRWRNEKPFFGFVFTSAGRLAMAFLVSVLSFIFTSICLGTVDHLFFDVASRWYEYAWVAAACLVGPFCFLAFLPEDFDQEEVGYGTSSKVLFKFFLIPAVAVYALILLVYFVQALVTAEWPVGGVVYMSAGLLSFGWIAFFVASGLREKDGWFHRYPRLFPILSLPYVVALFIAIGRRIWEYGTTLDRVLAILLGAWFLTLAVRFFKPGRSLVFIPVSLMALAIVFSVGPWSAASIAERLQAERLADDLRGHGLLRVDRDVFREKWTKLSDERRRAIAEDAEHLLETYGEESLGILFAPRVAQDFRQCARGGSLSDPACGYWQIDPKGTSRLVALDTDPSFRNVGFYRVSDKEYLVFLEGIIFPAEERAAQPGVPLVLRTSKSGEVSIAYASAKETEKPAVFDAGAFFSEYAARNTSGESGSTIRLDGRPVVIETPSLSVSFFVRRMNVETGKDPVMPYSLYGMAVVRIK
jgi:hypothetical protein